MNAIIVVASPPVRRATSRTTWRVHVGLHVLSLLTGALVLGFVVASIAALAGRLPTAVVGAVAAIAAAASLGVAPSLPSSPWRVPQSWARLGAAGYSAAFGFVLGLGVVTSLPSAGFAVLLAWAAAAPWNAVWPVFAAFAAARAAPLLVAIALGPGRVSSARFAWTARRLAPAGRVAEAMILTAAAIMLLL